jgi:hypothetical protein
VSSMEYMILHVQSPLASHCLLTRLVSHCGILAFGCAQEREMEGGGLRTVRDSRMGR